ncbi:MAG: ABC transporter ATP-binding protein [Acidimicrobiia bacterium]|nr:ABC transporter ATP-binding protein [Acidimicrobiia bacterium]MYE67401.1 ABC transporter ATP-binding protein [Acidimicrobiia bacterium]
MTRYGRDAYDVAVPPSPPSVAAPASDGLSARSIGAPVSIRGVSKWFRTGRSFLQALEGIDIDIRPGEFLSLIGPSGCGKSTLLRLVGGLLPYEEGAVEVDGNSPARARDTKQIGFAPQTPSLLAWRTVRRNVTLLAEVNRRGAIHPPLGEAQVLELLETVGLGDFLDRLPKELSGGMQQRVSLVRCFALGAPVLLMDEPFSALDEITRNEMRYLLLDLWERTGHTVIFVTHSIPEAVILSDRVLVMATKPGRVVHAEDIELPRPRSAAMEDDDRFLAHMRSVRRALGEVSAR